MGRVLFFFGLLVSLQSLTAQKLVKKTLLKDNISKIQIDVGNCFEIDLATSDLQELIIEAQIDGEYKKDLLLNVTEQGSTIGISAAFQPNFINPNDKLSAHKVISIALKVLLPEHKTVHVFGTHCNVSATGVYELLNISLNDGRCDLVGVSENVEVVTQSGPISAFYEKAKVTAKSKYGKIIGPDSNSGNGQYDLRTVTGNILLKRVE